MVDKVKDGKQVDDSQLMDDKGAFSGTEQSPGEKSVKAEAKTGKSGGEQQPSRVKVKVGNEEIETDPASAAFMNAMMGQIADLSNQLKAGYKQQAEPKSKAAPEDEYDYETGLFTEPKVALARLRSEIKAEVKAEMTQAYTAAESKKEFWSTFYGQHPDLKDEKLLVEAILARDYSKLSNMEVAKAAETLSKSVKTELLRLRGGKTDADDSNDAHSEGSTTRNSPSGGRKSEGGDILSLSDLVRKRQEARRKAQFGIKG